MMQDHVLKLSPHCQQTTRGMWAVGTRDWRSSGIDPKRKKAKHADQSSLTLANVKLSDTKNAERVS